LIHGRDPADALAAHRMTILEGFLPFIVPMLLDADWLQRVGCGALIGWSLQ